MAMRETVKSLSIYFIVVGVLKVLGSISALDDPLPGLLKVMVFLDLGVAVGFLYCGSRLREILRTNPGFAKTVVWVNIVLAVSVPIYIFSITERVLAVPIIGLALGIYILAQLNRLALEAQADATGTSEVFD